jgi:hypothetical protein
MLLEAKRMKTKKIKKPNIEVLINNLETRQEV